MTVAPSVSAAAAVRYSHSAAEAQMPSSSQQQQPRHVAASVSTTRYGHVTGPQVTAASRAQLMPFILGVSRRVFVRLEAGRVILSAARTRTELVWWAFSVAAAHTWNSLPSDIRSCHTVQTFKNTSKHTCLDSHNLKPPAPLYPL